MRSGFLEKTPGLQDLSFVAPGLDETLYRNSRNCDVSPRGGLKVTSCSGSANENALLQK